MNQTGTAVSVPVADEHRGCVLGQAPAAGPDAHSAAVAAIPTAAANASRWDVRPPAWFGPGLSMPTGSRSVPAGGAQWWGRQGCGRCCRPAESHSLPGPARDLSGTGGHGRPALG